MAAFYPEVSYFTSRGYAVLQVNYRGSSGYGRVYRDKLRGNWGISDVEDSVSGAQYLVDQGLADRQRLAIMGGSAGGFTVLKAMEEHPDFFKAGVTSYGVSDIYTMATDTHKFEAHYMDLLVGKLPEATEIYRVRSPIFHLDKIKRPVAVFQGADDQVVVPSQSEEVVASLRRRGIPQIYHLYEGEGHGFHKPETLAHFYTAVEQFLSKYMIYG
jgi:dipeptidyl aminopeptidase/acylaminoacyl peptidase